MKLSWKVLVVFLGVFLAGAVVGGFASLRFARSFVQARGVSGDQFVASNLKRLQERLQLTSEQAAKIERIIAASGEEMKRMRQESVRVMRQMDTKIEAELDARQRAEFTEMRRRWRERSSNRPGSPRGDGERPPPPRNGADRPPPPRSP
jgi:biopolymer transport protein ExbB/TolQ